MSMKDAYCEKMKSDLQEWQERLSQLQTEAQRDLECAIASVRAKSEAVAARLKELGHPGDKDWEARKAHLEQALVEFRRGVSQVASRINRAA